MTRSNRLSAPQNNKNGLTGGLSKTQNTPTAIAAVGVFLVEVGRVELPSENTLTRLSPGAGGYFGSLTLPVPLSAGKPSRRRVR